MLVFAALSRAGGVRGAATALGIPRSTVSRRLVQLEKSVGAPLVVRTARRFALTDLGASFLVRCEQLEELLRGSEELVGRASAEPSGTLRIAAAPVLGEEILPGIVADLMRAYPRLSVDVRLSVDYVDLRQGRVDVALRAWPLDDATDLFAVRLGESTTGCYASPGYLRERGKPKVPADLAAHDCIIVGSASPPSWTFVVGARPETIRVSGRVHVDSFRVARAIAVEGVGIVRTARIFAEALVAEGKLVPVLQRYWPKIPLHAVHAGANPPPPKVRAFIALARKAVAKMFQAA